MPKNAVDPVLNKLSVFLMKRAVRNIVCQRHCAIDFDKVLNSGKILLVNLATGLLTEKTAEVLGSFVVTKIVNAAFRRATLPQHRRRPWHLHIDEFQNFMNISVGFERILAESRKYNLSLHLANQYAGQLSHSVRQAIFGNIGSMIAFRMGIEDATIVAKEMGVFEASEIMNLEVGEAIARAGSSKTAYNLKTYPDPAIAESDPTAAIRSRMHFDYATPRKEVDRVFDQQRQTGPDRQSQPDPGKGDNNRSKGHGQNRKSPPRQPRDPNEDDFVN